MVIWIIGLSGAGKTTLASEVVRRMSAAGRRPVWLDGDALREVWGDVGYTMDDRQRNAQRISYLCRLLDAQGFDVVTSILSMFPEWQAWNRAQFSRYFEVFLDVPMDILTARDAKGLYAGAREGRISNVVGVDVPFPMPPAPDLVITPPDILLPVDQLASRVLASAGFSGA